MNKFTKGCLIVAAALTVAGLVSAVIAGTRGFSWSDIKEKSQSQEFHIGPVYMYTLEPYGLKISWGRQAQPDEIKTQDYKFTQNEIQKLRIDAGAGDVKVVSSEKKDDLIYVHTDTGGSFAYDVSNVDGTLTINVHKEMNVFQFGIFNGNDQPDVTVQLPDNIIFDNVHIEAGSGDIDIMSSFTANELDCQVGSGDLKTESALYSEDYAEMITGSGDIRIGQIICRGDLDVIAGSGDVEVDGRSEGNINVSCGSGSVKMNLDGKPENWNYEVKSGSGDILVNNRVFNGRNETYSEWNGAKKMNISLTGGSGDIILNID